MKKLRPVYWITAAGGVICAALTAAETLRLQLGTAGDRAALAALLLALLALALCLVWRELRDVRAVCLATLPAAAALLVRAMCLDYVSGDYENFLSVWVEFFRLNGGYRAIAQNIGNYNVPYLYMLAGISYLKIPDLYLIKWFSVLFDVLLAWGGLRLTRVLRGKRQGDWGPLAAFLAVLFLPTVVLNGSYWGQCDAVYAAIAVHAMAFLLEGKGGWSAALMGIAFSFKLQTVFILPLWGVMWLAKRVKFRQLWMFPAAYAVTLLPALLLKKPLLDMIGVYFNQAKEYTRLTLNAPSVFQFVPYGMEVNETLLSRLGIAAAFALAAALLAVGLIFGRKLDRGIFYIMAVALAVGVPFFLPHMHERYFFLADVLAACWACADRRRVPVCVLTVGASLGSYLVYLRLQYNVVISICGMRFTMAVEGAMMLAALILTGIELVRRLNVCKAKMINREDGV